MIFFHPAKSFAVLNSAVWPQIAYLEQLRKIVETNYGETFLVSSTKSIRIDDSFFLEKN